MSTNNGIAKGEKIFQNTGLNGVAGRERTCHVGTGALVGQDPEVEFGKEAGEIGQGSLR